MSIDLPRRRPHVVGVRAELDGEVERDALDDDRERKDGERLPELGSGEAVDACAARLDRARELRETGGTWPAAVEADECVASVEREPRSVQELLHGEALGEHVRGLAHLERSFGRGPLIRSGAHELEAALGQLDRGARRCQRVCDRFRNRLELTELGAQSLSKLRETAERTQMARGERAGGLLCDRLDIGTRRAFAADRDRRERRRHGRVREPRGCSASCRGGSGARARRPLSAAGPIQRSRRPTPRGRRRRPTAGSTRRDSRRASSSRSPRRRRGARRAVRRPLSMPSRSATRRRRSSGCRSIVSRHLGLRRRHDLRGRSELSARRDVPSPRGPVLSSRCRRSSSPRPRARARAEGTSCAALSVGCRTSCPTAGA